MTKKHAIIISSITNIQLHSGSGGAGDSHRARGISRIFSFVQIARRVLVGCQSVYKDVYGTLFD